MNYQLNNLYLALLTIIPLSAAPRIIVCLIKMNTDPDQAQMYKTRMINAGLFIVVAEIAMSVLELIYLYLS